MERTVTLDEKDWLVIFEGLDCSVQEASMTKQWEEAEEVKRKLKEQLGITEEELDRKRVAGV